MSTTIAIADLHRLARELEDACYDMDAENTQHALGLARRYKTAYARLNIPSCAEGAARIPSALHTVQTVHILANTVVLLCALARPAAVPATVVGVVNNAQQ